MSLYKDVYSFFEKHPWVFHIPQAAVLQALIGLALWLLHVPNFIWIAAAVVSGFFWGWKVCEFQTKLVGSGHSKGPVWWRGFTPIEWLTYDSDTRAYVLQFAAPVLTVVGISLLIQHFS